MKVTLGCLLLIFGLLFGGCSLFSSTPLSQQPSGDTTNNKAGLEKQEQDKQGELVKLKEDLKEQQKKATDERAECKRMMDDTKSRPDGKNPRDANDAPKTVAKCQSADIAEGQVKETNGKIETAEKELTDIQNQIKQSPVNTSDYSWLISLIIGVAGVLGLGILLGGLYLLLSKRIDKAIAAERALNQQSFERIRAKHDKFNALFAEHGKVMNDLERLVKLQHGKIEVLEFKVKGDNSARQLQSQPINEQPQFIKPEPQFPVSAEAYLNRVGNQAEMATPDKFSEGLLVQDPSKDEEFIIVKDPTTADGLFYAMPKFTRFSMKSEYNLYYRTYYDCENPAGGTVWIIAPTIVRRVDGGWKLEQKGKLEVR